MSEEEENGQLDSKDRDVFVEPKPKPTLIRVLTVMAYMLSVSMAAILLSAYYIFMWDGHPNLARKAPMAEPRVDVHVHEEHPIEISSHGHFDLVHDSSYETTLSINSVASRIVDGTGDGSLAFNATERVRGFGESVDVRKDDRSKNTSPMSLNVWTGGYGQKSPFEKSNATAKENGHDENNVTNERLATNASEMNNKIENLETNRTASSTLIYDVKIPNQTPKYEETVTPTPAQFPKGDVNESNTEMDNSSLDVAVSDERNLLYKRYFYKNFLK